MRTVRGEAQHEELIKKSRFLARASRADAPEEAMDFLQRARDETANHNCWAYRIGELYRFSDDGEPGGTAGRPILSAIDGQGVDHVMVVVTRHFGGIKLGAGGLVRAYGGTAATCLRLADQHDVTPRVRLEVHVPFDCTGEAYLLVTRLGLTRVDERYTDTGLVLVLDVEEDRASLVEESMKEATRGRASVMASP